MYIYFIEICQNEKLCIVGFLVKHILWLVQFDFNLQIWIICQQLCYRFDHVDGQLGIAEPS